MTDEGVLLVSNTVSMAWTEIGLLPADYPAIAQKLNNEGATWPQVRSIALRDVCGSLGAWSEVLYGSDMSIVPRRWRLGRKDGAPPNVLRGKQAKPLQFG